MKRLGAANANGFEGFYTLRERLRGSTVILEFPQRDGYYILIKIWIEIAGGHDLDNDPVVADKYRLWPDKLPVAKAP